MWEGSLSLCVLHFDPLRDLVYGDSIYHVGLKPQNMSSKNYRLIVMLGPQGSGKGTQGELLADHLKFPIITMSTLLRKEIASGSERGKKIKELIDVGNLAPQEITNELLEKRLKEPDAVRGAIIDGYPRDRIQFDAFQQFAPPTDVVFLDITDALAVERISGRRMCACGKIYNVQFNPPQKEGICDACGSKLTQRVDDVPDAIKTRLGIYHRETEAVIDEYRKLGLLRAIDASGPIHMVHEEILKALDLGSGN